MIRLKKGILLVFEGIDGGGKTTQAGMLLEELTSQGYDAVYFREPSDSRWGREIKAKARERDSLSPRQELDLFQKDRQENVKRNLRPALAEKRVVLLDRYYFSTIAYQGAKGIDPEYIRKLNEEFAAPPDLVFILDIAAGQGLERIDDRGEKDLLFEREDYLARVRRIFLGFQEPYIIHLDACRAQDEIAEEIKTIALKYLNRFRV